MRTDLDPTGWSASLRNRTQQAGGPARETSMRSFTLALILFAPLVIGCTSRTPTVTNPFNTADRVPPPTLRGADGVGAAPAYYPNAPAYPAATTAAPAWPATPSNFPAATAPGFQSGATFQQSAPAYQPDPAAFPQAAPAPLPGSATPMYGAPPLGGSASSFRQSSPGVAGDAISIPPDSGSLRFATQAESSLARNTSQPLQRSNATRLAAAPTRRAATASGWIANSGPVRSNTSPIAPRVRMPGGDFDREPVSLAAMGRQSGVPIAPLEPTGISSQRGEPAPLRVASPPSDTGWR